MRRDKPLAGGTIPAYEWQIMKPSHDDDYCLTTISHKTEKAGLPSVFNGFHKIQRNGMFSPKTSQPLKIQHFIRIRLKTPTLSVARSNRVGRTKMP